MRCAFACSPNVNCGQHQDVRDAQLFASSMPTSATLSTLCFISPFAFGIRCTFTISEGIQVMMPTSSIDFLCVAVALEFVAVRCVMSLPLCCQRLLCVLCEQILFSISVCLLMSCNGVKSIVGPFREVFGLLHLYQYQHFDFDACAYITLTC
jgi:hypothetical protein